MHEWMIFLQELNVAVQFVGFVISLHYLINPWAGLLRARVGGTMSRVLWRDLSFGRYMNWAFSVKTRRSSVWQQSINRLRNHTEQKVQIPQKAPPILTLWRRPEEPFFGVFVTDKTDFFRGQMQKNGSGALDKNRLRKVELWKIMTGSRFRCRFPTKTKQTEPTILSP